MFRGGCGNCGAECGGLPGGGARLRWQGQVSLHSTTTQLLQPPLQGLLNPPTPQLTEYSPIPQCTLPASFTAQRILANSAIYVTRQLHSLQNTGQYRCLHYPPAPQLTEYRPIPQFKITPQLQSLQNTSQYSSLCYPPAPQLIEYRPIPQFTLPASSTAYRIPANTAVYVTPQLHSL